VAIRYPLIEGATDVGDLLIHVDLAAREAEAAFAAECDPFLVETMWTQIRGVARLGCATAQHLLDDVLHVASPISRMTLLERLPMIPKNLLEGVFIDPWCCKCHSWCLYHVSTAGSTLFYILI
jgi:hypothetical protein